MLSTGFLAGYSQADSILSLCTCTLQVTVIDEQPNPNISTFRPLDQQINDNKKYNGMGYMPCNG